MKGRGKEVINKAINKYTITPKDFEQEMLIHSICDLYNEMNGSDSKAKFSGIDRILTIEFETAYAHQLNRTAQLIKTLDRVGELKAIIK